MTSADMSSRLQRAGYFASEKLAKYAALFERAGHAGTRDIPACVLLGPPGSGKTFLAEAFCQAVCGKLFFLQAYPGMGPEAFIADVDIAATIRRDAANAVRPGLLVRAIQATTDGPSVVVVDELDKARPEGDAFLLDFLTSGRVSTGSEEFRRHDGPIWVFVTSNGERELAAPLVNRCRRIEVPRPSEELFLQILGVKTDSEREKKLRHLYRLTPGFSIRQAKSLLCDLDALEVAWDDDIVSQYVGGSGDDAIHSVSAFEALEERVLRLERGESSAVYVEQETLDAYAAEREAEYLAHGEDGYSVDYIVSTSRRDVDLRYQRDSDKIARLLGKWPYGEVTTSLPGSEYERHRPEEWVRLSVPVEPTIEGLYDAIEFGVRSEEWTRLSTQQATHLLEDARWALANDESGIHAGLVKFRAHLGIEDAGWVLAIKDRWDNVAVKLQRQSITALAEAWPAIADRAAKQAAAMRAAAEAAQTAAIVKEMAAKPLTLGDMLSPGSAKALTAAAGRR